MIQNKIGDEGKGMMSFGKSLGEGENLVAGTLSLLEEHDDMFKYVRADT